MTHGFRIIRPMCEKGDQASFGNLLCLEKTSGDLLLPRPHWVALGRHLASLNYQDWHPSSLTHRVVSVNKIQTRMNFVDRKARQIWKAGLLNKIQDPERASHFPNVPWLARADIWSRALVFQLSEVTQCSVLPSVLCFPSALILLTPVLTALLAVLPRVLLLLMWLFIGGGFTVFLSRLC